jgi:hypothetical protein
MRRNTRKGDAALASSNDAAERLGQRPDVGIPYVGTADLAQLSPDLLRRRWRVVIGRPAPPRLPRQLMIRILVWREQVARVGDLDARTLARLAAARVDNTARANPVDAPTPSRPRPGSVLVREQAGVHHRVEVLDQGYAWNSQAYPSLSAVARAITGTNWNGPRFFGLDRPTVDPNGQSPSPSDTDTARTRRGPR